MQLYYTLVAHQNTVPLPRLLAWGFQLTILQALFGIDDAVVAER